MKFDFAIVKDKWVNLVFILVFILLCGASWWAFREFYSSPPYVDPERYPVRGIDVSSHNGIMNLNAAAASGIEFVFIKATEGGSFRDRNFFINYEKAQHAGLKIGAYHFFRFDIDGIVQAKNLLSRVHGLRLELGFAIDVESQGNATGIPADSVKKRLGDMIDYMNLKGIRPIIYTNRQGYEKYLLDSFPGCTLWICSFTENPIDAEWTFWQFDHHGHVPGIKGDVDLDVFCGNRAEWVEFLNGEGWPYTPHTNLNSRQ